MNTKKKDIIIMFTNSKFANICLSPRFSPNKILNEEFESNGKFN